MTFGDVDGGFAEADEIFEDTLFYEGNTHLPMEQHAAIGVPEDDDRVTLYSSSQTPHYVHRALSKVLELPASRVRVVATPNGVTPNVDMMSLRPEMAGGIEPKCEFRAFDTQIGGLPFAERLAVLDRLLPDARDGRQVGHHYWTRNSISRVTGSGLPRSEVAVRRST